MTLLRAAGIVAVAILRGLPNLANCARLGWSVSGAARKEARRELSSAGQLGEREQRE